MAEQNFGEVIAMGEQDFLARMKEILDNEDVTLDKDLADIEEWDSISFVSYMGLANAVCGKRPTPEQVQGCVTVRDLYLLLVK